MTVHRVLDPSPVESLDDDRYRSGLQALEAARSIEPEAIIQLLLDSGLRGRGGAGFPTGTKWETVRNNAASGAIAPTVVVNAAEGEPGTFGDRTLMLRNPYRVLEGALIAAHAIGSASIVVVTKDRYRAAFDRMETAAADLVATGLTNGVDIEVVGGPNHYLLGEETGLLEAAAGRPPFPRIAPPFRHGTTEMGNPGGGAAGLHLSGPDGDAPPTLVNNVETLAHVPDIVMNDASWFRSLGTEDSAGTSVFTVSGDVAHAGVGEFALGTPVGEIIEELGGGVPDGEIAFVLSGIANGILAAESLDVPATYEAMQTAGSGLGTGGFMVFSTATSPVAVAHGVSRFLAIESCGQCTPCKQGGLHVAGLLDELRAGDSRDDAVEVIVDALRGVPEGARCDLGRQHERVVSSLLATFAEVSISHAVQGIEAAPVLIAPILDIDDEGVAHIDEDHATKLPDWEHGTDWNGQSPADRHDVSVSIT